jgi:hypothetical protein
MDKPATKLHADIQARWNAALDQAFAPHLAAAKAKKAEAEGCAKLRSDAQPRGH